MKFLILAATITMSFGLTHLVRKSAIKRNKFDIPNERSSHKNPTPRGGGVAVVAAFVFGLLALLIRGEIAKESFYAIVLPGALVAIVGFLDDLGRVTATLTTNRPLCRRCNCDIYFGRFVANAIIYRNS